MDRLLRAVARPLRIPHRPVPLALLCLSFALFAASCDRRAGVEHYNRGVSFAEAGQYSRAIDEFQQALKLVEDFPESHNGLGYVFNQMGRYEEAIEHFRAAAEDEDFDQRALAYQNLGTSLANTERYEEAESALQASIELEPLAKSYVALAQVYAVQGKSGRALGQLENALRHDETLAPSIWTDPVFARYLGTPEFTALGERYAP